MCAWQTWTPGYTRDWISRCLGGVNIPCWPVTPPRANSLNRVNGAICSQISVWKRRDNCLETCRTAFHFMTDCMDKLVRFFDNGNWRNVAFTHGCWNPLNTIFDFTPPVLNNTFSNYFHQGSLHNKNWSISTLHNRNWSISTLHNSSLKASSFQNSFA